MKPLFAVQRLQRASGGSERAPAEAMTATDDSADRWERLLCAAVGLA